VSYIKELNVYNIRSFKVLKITCGVNLNESKQKLIDPELLPQQI